ncbi:LANO_0G16644g1_1 [Lachancea nothofagi CBS 11611]|uniref:LANO_0G16644g1_1 n=1 Tax=Lachancea nothofagi CBS 11611 TaxID=1266666 RepID=A0A1G4KKM3_9SACH|nr:LANO_0G16644g1_1 [Lachancea nothofagi CBS 11611]
MVRINSYGQEIGDEVVQWKGSEAPKKVDLEGKYCKLEPLDVEKHAAALFDAYSKAPDDRMWTYLPIGPFKDYSDYRNFLLGVVNSSDSVSYAIVNHSNGRAVGTLAAMRFDIVNGTVEIGYVIFSPELQRTAISTEAQYLLMKYIFDVLKYRRCEWKCDSLNCPSRNAALRLGFKLEGTFRNAAVYKGRSRDTTWLSVTESEWADLRTTFTAWLSEDNFDEGVQKRKLTEIREKIKAIKSK